MAGLFAAFLLNVFLIFLPDNTLYMFNALMAGILFYALLEKAGEQ